MPKNLEAAAGLKKKIYDVIFGYESKAGRLFDIVLI